MKFQNAFYQVEGQEEEGCRLSLRIQVSPEETKKAYKQAIKRVNKEISVPGFRKGKAPDETVVKNYGTHVEREWKDILLNDAFQAALDLTKIYPLTKNSVQKPKIEKCSLEEGAVVSLAYEHYPNVPTIDFSALKLPSLEKAPVSQERVDEILHSIQQSNADWEDITGRAIQEGDYVDLTIDAIDEEPVKNIVKNRRFEMSDKQVAPWLKRLLLGLESGATVEGTSEVDEKADASIKEKFKPTKVRITVHGIKKILLPELDDELAKKAGASSKEDLIAKIHENLNQEAEDELRQNRFRELEKALLREYHFDLPQSLMQEEREERTRRKIQELKKNQLSDEQIREHEKQVEQEVLKEANEALRLYFLNKQLIEQGKITVSNKELNEEIVRQVTQNPMYYGRDMEKELTKEMVSRMASSLLQRKAKEYALAQVGAK